MVRGRRPLTFLSRMKAFMHSEICGSKLNLWFKRYLLYMDKLGNSIVVTRIYSGIFTPFSRAAWTKFSDQTLDLWILVRIQVPQLEYFRLNTQRNLRPITARQIPLYPFTNDKETPSTKIVFPFYWLPGMAPA